MAHTVSARRLPDRRLRDLLARSFGDEQARSLLTEFGGNVGQAPRDINELAGRIGGREGDANRLRFRPQNRPAADVASGLNLLQRGGLSVRSSAAPQRISGIRLAGAPRAQEAPGQTIGGTGGDRDVEGRIALSGARRASAEADLAQTTARRAAVAPATPLEAAQQGATARSFRARRGGIQITPSDDGVTQVRNVRGRPGIDESGEVELRQDAESFADPNFAAAQQARQADLLTGAGGTGDVSPAIQTALINERRDQTRFGAQADRQRIDQEFRNEIATLTQFGLNERQANQIASQNAQAKMRALGTFTQNQQQATRFGQTGGFGGFGEEVDPDIQSALDAQRAGIETFGAGESPTGEASETQARASLAAQGATPEEIERWLTDPEARVLLGLP